MAALSNMPTLDWVVDPCQDANGFHTIRVADKEGQPDIHIEPVATVYLEDDAHMIAASTAMHKILLDIHQSLERGYVITGGQRFKMREALLRARGHA